MYTAQPEKEVCLFKCVVCCRIVELGAEVHHPGEHGHLLGAQEHYLYQVCPYGGPDEVVRITEVTNWPQNTSLRGSNGTLGFRFWV